MRTTEVKKALDELSKNIKNHLFNQDNKQNTAVSLRPLKDALTEAYGEYVSNQKGDNRSLNIYDTYLIFTKRLAKICKILDKFISIEINPMPENIILNNDNNLEHVIKIGAYLIPCQKFINLINSSEKDFKKFEHIYKVLIKKDVAFRNTLEAKKVEIKSLDFVSMCNELLGYAKKDKFNIIRLYAECKNLLLNRDCKNKLCHPKPRKQYERNMNPKTENDENLEKGLTGTNEGIDKEFDSKYGELKDIHKKVRDLVKSFKVGKDTINEEIKPLVKERSTHFIDDIRSDVLNGYNKKKLRRILTLIEKNNPNLKSDDSEDVKNACADIAGGIKDTKIGIQCMVKNKFLKLKNEILKKEAKRQKEAKKAEEKAKKAEAKREKEKKKAKAKNK